MATTTAPTSQALQLNYSTGEKAVRLNDFGCGFCYYLSGRVAACITQVNSYQKKYQFFQDNLKNTLLGLMDEHVIGTIGTSKSKYKIIFTKESGILFQNHPQQNVVKEWKWMSSTSAEEDNNKIVIELNEALVFTYQNRFNIKMVFFPCPNVKVEFEMGEKLRRTDTYLDHAFKIKDGPKIGHLDLNLPTPTLEERQKQIELTSIEKRSKQKPRSQDFQKHHEMKQLVSQLEKKFDTYQGCQVQPGPDEGWKEQAHFKSLQEIPILQKTGFEVGKEPRFFGQPITGPNDSSHTVTHLKDQETGKWLESVEVRHRLAKENPLLKRSACLNNASGRYSRDRAVPGSSSSSHESDTLTDTNLELVSGSQLDVFLQEKCEKDHLVIVACLRDDDHQSRVIEKILEKIYAMIQDVQQHPYPPKSSPQKSNLIATASKCRLVKCNLAESKALSDKYRIHAVPTFLIFYDTRLVHVTSMGGMALRVNPSTKNSSLSHQMYSLPRVLLVEKNTKQQIAIEKILRKEEFQWDLAISGEQAIVHFTRPPMTSASKAFSSTTVNGYGMVILSDSMDDKEIRSMEKFVRSKDRDQNPIVCAIVVSKSLTEVQFATTMCIECKKAQGRRVSSEENTSSAIIPLACAHCGIITTGDKSSVISATLGEVGEIIIYKHIKAATLHRIAERWASKKNPSTNSTSTSAVQPTMETHKGLTGSSFFKEMEIHLNKAKRGIFLPQNYVPEMALSANDTVLHGTIKAIANK